MINELLLLSKNDIPFIEAQVNIHQPTISEISFISEESFHIGCQLLTFSKKLLSQQDKSNLENTSDFEIFMSIMNSPESVIQRAHTIKVLTLLFPEYEVLVTKENIILKNENHKAVIDANNFLYFQRIIKDMFDMESSLDESQEPDYNPADAFAAKIAEKLKKRRNVLAEKQKDNISKIAIFSRFISILAVGEKKDMNDLMQYSVYQLKDEMKRFKLKDRFDMYVKAKMAGAQDLEEVDDWMKDIHL
ncbi:MAG: hypothetical protein IJZ77_02790 [Bacilli bacterium]|nr:hypothetical protein [Bacilli bacterium]